MRLFGYISATFEQFGDRAGGDRRGSFSTEGGYKMCDLGANK